MRIIPKAPLRDFWERHPTAALPLQVWYKDTAGAAITARLTTASGEKKGCLVILFSQLNNNMLLAEVSDNQNGGRGLQHILSVFDQSISYLFLFDIDGNIEQCYTENINYN